jgi:hypothetical protein
MIRRRKFLTNFEIFKNKSTLKFNVIIDNVYFMENLYKYSTTKRVFLKKRKHFFVNYKNHYDLKLFGFSYVTFKKQSKILISNFLSVLVVNNFFFFSKLFSYNNKSKLAKHITSDNKKNIIAEISMISMTTVSFQFVKLLTLQRQVLTLLLKIDFVFRKKNKL